ncbi:hypothetical protein [Arsenicibacter rosenii]|uniref:Uncharacterized protein n=1 Tax=Arsenicibacter rosenii TaxID=1750698 RepID=A0A1S2VFM0_9BACT|nr:hypothetical protein [Arsenicibacter rosenii]OIN57523.1 hypothetical protein BLX24_18710 [Arsenicibacter rosenii]
MRILFSVITGGTVILAPVIAFAQQSANTKPAKRSMAYELPLNDTLRLATNYEAVSPPLKDGASTATVQTPAAGFPPPALMPVSTQSVPAGVTPAMRSDSKATGADAGPRMMVRPAVRQTTAPAVVADSAGSDLERLLNRKKRIR